MPAQYRLRGTSAAEIVGAVERALRDGRLAAGEALPPVRALAEANGVSAATVAAAYRELSRRGLARGHGRMGTRIAERPPFASRIATVVPPGLRDLATGNPDITLLPPLDAALRAAAATGPSVYGEAAEDAAFVRLAAKAFGADGIPADDVAVVSGALDGVERALGAHLRPGDLVAVEEPGYPGVLDLVAAAGLVAVPVAIDDSGPRPDALAAALRRPVAAFVFTPRAQNPTGAALDRSRASALRRVLRDHPSVLVVEDDHAGAVAGVAAVTLADPRRERWAVVRSVAKSLGPDLRVAAFTGDATTVARVRGRQRLGPGWVSHLLQGTVANLWSDRTTAARLRRADRAYAERRNALVATLSHHGIEAHGRSGLNVWVPVPDEAAAVAGLAAAGYAVAAGGRFFTGRGSAVRVTTATLLPAEAPAVAAALAAALDPGRTTRGG